MTRAFSALLWKERFEVGKAAWLPLAWAAILFYQWVPTLSADGLSDPRTALKLGLFLLMGSAATVGYQQTQRESSRDMWAFAFHRPVASAEIFAAKVVAGGVPLVVSMLIGGTLTLWVTSIARELPSPERWGYWLMAIGDGVSMLTYYAAGLNLGTPGGRGTRGYFGAGIAFAGTFIVRAFEESNPIIGMALSLVLTLVVMTMAYLGFTDPAELEGAAQLEGAA